MTVRAIKVKGEKLSFLAHADSAEQLVTGELTGETGGEYSNVKPLYIKGTYIYWIDMAGNERRKEGTATGETGTAGVIKVKGEEIYYNDDNGDGRHFSELLGYLIASSTTYPLARIRRASDGTLWVIYVLGTSLYIRSSTDDGVTWSSAELVVTESYSGTAYGIHPDLVLDSNDVPHIVYTVRTGTTSQRRLYYTNRIGGTWSAKEDILSELSYFLYPRVAVDSSDNIHCIFRQWGSAYYVKRTAGTWGSKVLLNYYTGICYWSQDIAIDSNDYVHVVYSSRRARTLCYRLWNGSWQSEVVLFTSDNYNNTQVVAQIALDSNDDAHIVWTGRGHGINTTKHNIQYIKQVSGVWQSQESLTDVAYHQAVVFGTNANIYNLTIAINALDEIDVCWQGAGHSATNIAWTTGNHIKYSGGAWSAIDVPIDESGTQVHQALWHKHPNSQGILASGYMLLYRNATYDLRFYEGD